MLNEVKSRLSGKNNIIKISFLSVAILFAAASLSLAQDSMKTTTKQHKSEMPTHSGKMDMKGMPLHSGNMDHNMNMDSSKKTGMDMKGEHSSPVAYKGVIDLKSIDDNKDGKVYQCPMDFNVLSDKPGVDPKCGMKLKEVSLQQAKENLTKHGYKVK